MKKGSGCCAVPCHDVTFPTHVGVETTSWALSDLSDHVAFLTHLGVENGVT